MTTLCIFLTVHWSPFSLMITSPLVVKNHRVKKPDLKCQRSCCQQGNVSSSPPHHSQTREPVFNSKSVLWLSQKQHQEAISFSTKTRTTPESCWFCGICLKLIKLSPPQKAAALLSSAVIRTLLNFFFIRVQSILKKH